MPLTGIGSSRGLAAGIVWGATFEKTLRFGFPMLDVRTYPVNRAGAETVRQQLGGAADGWQVGSDFLLAFRLPSIPPVSETDPFGYGDATGWDSVDGWEDFLAYARTKKVLRFAPVLASYSAADAATYREVILREPWSGAPEAGWNTYRSLEVVLKAVTAAPVTGY